MISFFKYQDPLRLSLIMIIMILTRLPVFFIGLPLLEPELVWTLAGHRLAEGSVMYRDVLDTLEPLSAGTYSIIITLFGDTHYVFLFFSLLLVFLQAILFNFIISINNLFPERNYIPSLLFVILSSLFIDFYTLSPALLGSTFLLLSIHFIFALIRSGDNDEDIFYTGVLISIASLFYFPFFVFLFLAILVFLFFTPTMLRKYFVLIMGFIFPYLLAGTYYFMRDGFEEFMSCITYAMTADTEVFVSWKAFTFISIIPIVYLVASFTVISLSSRYINYQYVAIRVFALWLVFALISIYFSDTFSPNQLYIFVPVLSFFLTHYFILVKNKWIRELSFLVLAVIILWVNIKTLYDFSKNRVPESYRKMAIHVKEGLPFDMKDNKVLVLGEDKSYYRDNRLGGPYLNWHLSKRYFSDLNNYKNISKIYADLSAHPPEVIVDQINIAPELFRKIPGLGEQYKKAGNHPVYLLKTR